MEHLCLGSWLHELNRRNSGKQVAFKVHWGPDAKYVSTQLAGDDVNDFLATCTFFSTQLMTFAQSYVLCVCFARGLIPEYTAAKDETVKADINALLFDLLVTQYDPPVMSEDSFGEFFHGDSHVEPHPTVMSTIFRVYSEHWSERSKNICEVCLWHKHLLFLNQLTSHKSYVVGSTTTFPCRVGSPHCRPNDKFNSWFMSCVRPPPR